MLADYVGLLLEINRTCLTAGKLKESDCEYARLCCCISVNIIIQIIHS